MMLKTNCPKPLKEFVKGIKRRFNRKLARETSLDDLCPVFQHDCHQLCGQNCRHQCAVSSFSKSATLPTKPLSSLACASPIEEFPSPTPSTSNNSILSADSGLGSQAPSDDEYGEDVFSDCVESDYEDYSESYVEDDSWWIDGNQITLKNVISASSWETVYSCYWHGNVEVHTRRSSDSELRAGVIADVNTLTSIRHENIQLFLGFSDNLHPDYVSIVMDQIKGSSLHDLVYKQRKQLNCQSVNKISKQLAQGIEYLHDKGIPHPMLSAKSVFVHYRVCISMLSHHGASTGHTQPEDVTYLPPEALKSLTTTEDYNGVELMVDPKTTLTQEANIYSFGTLLYEMLASEKPHNGQPLSTVVSLVCSDNVSKATNSLPEGKYKTLVQKCWRKQPLMRPTFKEILLTLEHTKSPKACGLKASTKLSFSEPKALNKLGL